MRDEDHKEPDDTKSWFAALSGRFDGDSARSTDFVAHRLRHRISDQQRQAEIEVSNDQLAASRERMLFEARRQGLIAGRKNVFSRHPVGAIAAGLVLFSMVGLLSQQFIPGDAPSMETRGPTIRKVLFDPNPEILGQKIIGSLKGVGVDGAIEISSDGGAVISFELQGDIDPQDVARALLPVTVVLDKGAKYRLEIKPAGP